MSEFLTSSGSISSIERIIQQAQNKLVIVSPHIQLSHNFYERLKERDRRGVKITFIYGKESLNDQELSKLQELKNIQLYYSENLHAKCYFNEQEAVISSMNLYSYSEKNREMGILIKKAQEPNVFYDLIEEVKSIKDQCLFNNSALRLQMVEKRGMIKAENNNGFCIRCVNKIPLNVNKPFCLECYEQWLDHLNKDLKEECCHGCGKPSGTSMAKPLCQECYIEVRAIIKF